MALQKKDGFTLIEMMIVIVILGVMASLVVPRLGELGDANMKRSARHLTGMIRFLRDESESRKAVYRLRFDVQGGRYWAEVMTLTSEQTPTVEFVPWQSAMGAEGSLSGQTTFRDVQVASHPDDPFIQFTPDGWVENAAIHLRNGDNKDFTLLVNPLAGNTELREGYIEESQS
ncbi:MAG TPA: prepilin-type N-terminal cleavage/methylation domain-containing protein [Nitrospirota bacterium]|nr:prepilin-type N-terminal cleavage/methylation domain-containing protein [Nitrospirota bacterium]